MFLRFGFRILGFFATLFRPHGYERSRPIEASIEHLTKQDIFWWAYKYCYKQVELPQPGVGIEELFSGERLDFPLAEGFTKQSSVILSAGGDILASTDVQFENTEHVWDEVGDFFFDADLVTANLESPIDVDKPFSGIPQSMTAKLYLNNTLGILERCINNGNGIKLYSTANNHALDMGEEGLMKTLDLLEQYGCHYVGTARSQRERDEFPVVEIEGVRIAFLSYTFSLSGKKIPDGKDYLVNLVWLNAKDCDITLIKQHIQIAKQEKKADIVVAFLHIGIEFESYPTKDHIDNIHRIMEAGADVIIGNHAHGFQPVEKYDFIDPFTNQKKQGLITYANGDLLAAQPTDNSRAGYLTKIEIQKGTDGNNEPISVISKLELKPYYLYSRKEHGRCTDFRLLDMAALMEKKSALRENQPPLSKKQIKKMRKLWDLVGRVLPKDQLV